MNIVNDVTKLALARRTERLYAFFTKISIMM